jgi:hypothetical protein
VPVPKLGKLRHDSALLDVAYVPLSDLQPPEAVLCRYHLAHSFGTDTIIDDPTGNLAALRDRVSRDFAKREWVRKRCADAYAKILRGFGSFEPFGPFPEQVTGWLFSTGVTTHVLLAAALQNPTVRRRYLAVRDVVDKRLYEELLELLGCRKLTRRRVQRHLDQLAVTFDATVPVARTPYPFSADLTPLARPIAIDGSQALIDAGDHREAVFWIAVTFARCHTVLEVDAPDVHQTRVPALNALLDDLGVPTMSAILDRTQATIAFLPRVWRAAEAVIDAR